jgi:hypothetical protein
MNGLFMQFGKVQIGANSSVSVPIENCDIEKSFILAKGNFKYQNYTDYGVEGTAWFTSSTSITVSNLHDLASVYSYLVLSF